MKASEIRAQTVAKRATSIDKAAALIKIPNSIDAVLRPAYKRSRVINTFVKDFISQQIEEDAADADGSVLGKDRLPVAIDAVLQEYLNTVTRWIEESYSDVKYRADEAKNVFELSDAKILASANKISRHVSTTMGNLWEELADISPRVVSPESDFGLAITGIDAIVLSDVVKFAQLKTQKNTLTGSQKNRSVAELRLHEYPLFVACVDTNTGWTFSETPGITRLVGREFWELIGMDYSLVIHQVGKMVRKIEKSYKDVSAAG